MQELIHSDIYFHNMIYCQKTLLRELDDCRKRNNANRNSCYPTHIAEWQKFAEETSLV